MNPATSDQVQDCIKNNYCEWGAPQLSLSKYFEREKYLSSFAFAQGNLQRWVFEENKEIKSACETYRRKCTVVSSKGLTKGYCYSVASVFTKSENRGKGYASKMMRALVDEILKDPECIASNLYSDVGPEFYSRLGWKLYNSCHYEILTNSIEKSPDARFLLDKQDWIPLIESDHLVCIEKMKKIHSETKSTVFLVDCDSASIEWRLARARFYAEAMNRTINAVGATINQSFCIWFHDFKTNQLEILRFSSESDSDTLQLLKAAATEAEKARLDKITLWTDHSLHSIVAGSLKERPDALSSLFLVANEPVIWLNNENYAWI